MITNRVVTYALALLLGSMLIAANSPLNLPEDVSRYFQTRTPTEDGVLTGNTQDIQAFRTYVLENWQWLLDHVDKLPRLQGQLTNTVGLIGAAAAYLGPTDYLNFVSKVLDLREAGRIPWVNVTFVLMGDNKKHGFLVWNWRDPRVRNLVERAKRLIPEDDKQTGPFLDDLLSGELAKPQNFFSGNISPDSPPPETLPPVLPAKGSGASNVEQEGRVAKGPSDRNVSTASVSAWIGVRRNELAVVLLFVIAVAAVFWLRMWKRKTD